MTMCALLVALSCPQVIQENRTKIQFTGEDCKVAEYCQKKCPEFDKTEPCLYRFVKTGEKNFYCGCGPEVTK